MLHALIMAGGAGSRFWPESRADCPKQLLALTGERTMIQQTVDRLGGILPDDRVLVLTGARLIEVMRRQLPQLPPTAILGEPCKRDTAPCIGLAALLVSRNDSDATMLVTPADHVIQPVGAFAKAVATAVKLVDAEPGRIVTFGIRPTYPAESFGYIQRGAPLGSTDGAYAVARFREKPPAAVAAEYLAAGDFYWNSGIFVWKARTILDALAEHQPQMLSHLRAIAAAYETPAFDQTFEREFAEIRGVSIDYAVMEKASDVAVIEAPFQWDDVGSWQAMARLRGGDADGNTISGKHLSVKTTGTIIRTDDRHLVVTVGLEDAIVVHTPDATLVATRREEESIRRIVKLLEERNWREYL